MCEHGWRDAVDCDACTARRANLVIEELTTVALLVRVEAFLSTASTMHEDGAHVHQELLDDVRAALKR